MDILFSLCETLGHKIYKFTSLLYDKNILEFQLQTSLVPSVTKLNLLFLKCAFCLQLQQGFSHCHGKSMLISDCFFKAMLKLQLWNLLITNCYGLNFVSPTKFIYWGPNTTKFDLIGYQVVANVISWGEVVLE